MSRRDASFPRVEGTAPRQAHCDLPGETYEREFGADGFFGPATHLLHAHPPTGWVNWEGPLRPRAFDLAQLKDEAATPWMAKQVLSNAHVDIRLWRTRGAMDRLVRNADGDELLFVHAGQGDLYCDFGHLAFGEGDYITLPRGTQWRVDCRGEAAFLMTEATGQRYQLPDRGMLGRHALFDPAVLRVPALDEAYDAQRDDDEWRVEIKRGGVVSTVTFPFNPLDTVGWQGDLLPMQLNWRDIRPLNAHRYHLPPSAHATFVADRFVVCTFCPRPLETDPGALKVPFFHSNNDFDEVIFYHAGDFFSRDDIGPGMLSLHPAGFSHGPHPGALKAAFEPKKSHTDEVAVMIDTRDALTVSSQAAGVERSGYVDSWKSP